MTFLDAVILGIVEGITEFLPVSSTGHLLVTQRLLGIPESEAANSFAIVIQLGAILAVMRLSGKRISKIVDGIRGRSEEGRRLLQCLIVAFMPAAVVGLALDDLIESYLFGPIPIVVAWIVGGIVILWWSRTYGKREGGRELEALHWRAALAIGALQCIAMWPGTSRSFITILAGVGVGLSLSAAVEFSFLLGVVTLGAASCYSGLKHWSSLDDLGFGLLAVGTIASFLSAYVAVLWMVDWIKRRGMAVFGYWRIAAGLFVGYLVSIGWM